MLKLFPTCIVITSFVLIRLGVVGVTLSAGSHLDMSVIVTVLKNYTGDSCQAAMASWDAGAGKDTEKECLWRKCTQQVQYKVDLGYSKVRMSDRMPFEYPRGLSREMFVREKNRQSRVLAERVRRLNNDAFQPFLYYEFEKLIRHFYDGHSRILRLFNLPMRDLVEERLSVSTYSQNQASELECSKIMPSILKFARQLVGLVEQNWQFEWGRHNDDVTDITFFEAVKYRIPPSPIPMIEAYQKETITKQKLIDHTNQLFRLLLEFWRDLSQNAAARENEQCNTMIAETEQIIRVRRNNMATLRFRFLSMTVVRMEESREYNNFNLLVDLGSTMGLYFGLTLLTLFELAIFFLFHNCRRPTKSTTAVATQRPAASAGGRRSRENQRQKRNAAAQTVVYSIPRPITVAAANASSSAGAGGSTMGAKCHHRHSITSSGNRARIVRSH